MKLHRDLSVLFNFIITTISFIVCVGCTATPVVKFDVAHLYLDIEGNLSRAELILVSDDPPIVLKYQFDLKVVNSGLLDEWYNGVIHVEDRMIN